MKDTATIEKNATAGKNLIEERKKLGERRGRGVKVGTRISFFYKDTNETV